MARVRLLSLPPHASIVATGDVSWTKGTRPAPFQKDVSTFEFTYRSILRLVARTEDAA